MIRFLVLALLLLLPTQALATAVTGQGKEGAAPIGPPVFVGGRDSLGELKSFTLDDAGNLMTGTTVYISSTLPDGGLTIIVGTVVQGASGTDPWLVRVSPDAGLASEAELEALVALLQGTEPDGGIVALPPVVVLPTPDAGGFAQDVTLQLIKSYLANPLAAPWSCGAPQTVGTDGGTTGTLVVPAQATVRIECDSRCSYAIGGAATALSIPLARDTSERFQMSATATLPDAGALVGIDVLATLVDGGPGLAYLSVCQ